jgi:hypothetical protein
MTVAGDSTMFTRIYRSYWTTNRWGSDVKIGDAIDPDGFAEYHTVVAVSDDGASVMLSPPYGRLWIVDKICQRFGW